MRIKDQKSRQCGKLSTPQVLLRTYALEMSRKKERKNDGGIDHKV